MNWGAIFSGIFAVIVILLLVVYWMLPYNEIEFSQNEVFDSNFSYVFDNSSLNGSVKQFYENMRYPKKEISYRIYECPLQKKNDLENAFRIISNLTVLDFYPAEIDEDIYATCDSENRIEEGLFIAGEGGPTKIIKTKNFNVILRGEILILRESKCPRPNVALHEIFHALGFNHSQNPGNIMYHTSNCNQEIGNDMIDFIDEIYSVQELPDLVLENSSASMIGRYLDLNFTILNNGLAKIEGFSLIIYADDKEIKKLEYDSLDIGYGMSSTLTNIFVAKISVNEISLVIESDSDELDKNNNEIKLEIKK